ncbi:NBS-LRR type resistance protein [Cucumis melo var. makuwa]|uniref:NBS-LRR type resistance protein n=1 Tax=Cucumis melo var. makuwa TaxID=1194695 RepID=A0A5D3E1X7_CUCMM|nr:NBS-LRR type resistance protein [Cucumis melo var. makuwa]
MRQRKHKETRRVHMAFTHPSYPTLVCPSPYHYLKSFKIKRFSGSVKRTHQSSDPEECTYQFRDPEGCTYQSSDPEGSHISLVIPKDAHISLVISKDTHISQGIPKDTVPVRTHDENGGMACSKQGRRQRSRRLVRLRAETVDGHLGTRDEERERVGDGRVLTNGRVTGLEGSPAIDCTKTERLP